MDGFSSRQGVIVLAASLPFPVLPPGWSRVEK
jgi:ATP-dependent Zn protease